VWNNKLKKYFRSHGYDFITAHYGARQGTAQGVSIAYPSHCYDLINTDVICIADSKKLWQEPPAAPFRPLDRLTRLFSLLFPSLASPPPLPPLSLKIDPLSSSVAASWNIANRAPNRMITLELAPKSSPSSLPSPSPSASFLVGNYHMPCYYIDEVVMAIHSCLASQHIQRLSQGTKPFIFAGDFNSIPTSCCYRLLTTGHIDQCTSDISATPLNSKDWKLILGPMRSSYAVHDGREPDHTNTSPNFCETIDYIFISEHWRVNGVIPLPSPVVMAQDLGELKREREREEDLFEQRKLYPSKEEPSDHLMIGAELELITDPTPHTQKTTKRTSLP
jgi:2',5'-phosphodiesterase